MPEVPRPPGEADPKLVIVDPGLTSSAGHHDSTTRCFAKAAGGAGYSTFVCAPREFRAPQDAPDRVVYLASLSTVMYGGHSADGLKLEAMPIDILHALRRAGCRAELLGRRSFFFFHTATLLQVAVAVRLLTQFLPMQGPRIKLCLRYEPSRDPEWRSSFSTQYRNALPGLVADGRLELFAETEELADRQAEYLGVTCRFLPHVAVTPSVSSDRRDAMPMPTVGHLGEARAAKGFNLLPDLIERMISDRDPPACRFVVQVSTRSAPPPDVRLATERLRALRAIAGDRLVLIEDPVSDSDYGSWMKRCDALLLPYDSTDYRRRGSGVVVEGLIAGKPMLVPAGTWMARMTAFGNGPTWRRGDDLASVLQRLLLGLAEFRAWAEAVAPIARRRHDPNVVFRTLVGEEAESAQQRRERQRDAFHG